MTAPSPAELEAERKSPESTVRVVLCLSQFSMVADRSRLQGTGLGLGDAAPLTQKSAVQADDAAAAWAGRPCNPPSSGSAQFVDQPQHSLGGRLRAVAGEQRRRRPDRQAGSRPRLPSVSMSRG